MAATHPQDPILVIGAGPAGLTLAAELARHGAACRIVDQAPAPSPLTKALILHARTLEVFADMGLADAVVAQGRILSRISLYDRGRLLMPMEMAHLDTPYPFLLDLPQSETERLLTAHLERCGVQVERGIELLGFTQDADGVEATLRYPGGQEEPVRTPWLIGCDGAHSTVRHTLGLAFEGGDYPEVWGLADVQVAWPLPADEGHIFMHPDGTVLVLPLPDGQQRIVMPLPPAPAGAPQTDPTLAEFQTYMEQRTLPGVQLSDPTWLTAYRIHHRKVRQYRQGRVFLAGDAAHIHSPEGGQGLNTGIQDAYNLAWKLALVAGGGANPALLDSYEVEREPVARAVLRLTDQLTRAMQVRDPLGQAVRHHLLAFFGANPALTRGNANTMAQLAVNYRHSPIVAQHEGGPLGRPGFHNGPQPGDRAPDAGPLTQDGAPPTRLFDMLRGPRHTLLLFAGPTPRVDSGARLDALARTVAARYGDHLQVYRVVAGDSVPTADSDGVLGDPQQALHERYGAEGDCLYLVRPDGYIGFRSRPADGASLQAYLDRIFA